jgi:hypothetical protein
VKCSESQVEKNDFNPDWDQMAVLVEENQRLAKQLPEMKDWEAVAADQAMRIAMMKQREWQGLTYAEISEEADRLNLRDGTLNGAISFANVIAAKLRKKNTCP